MGLKVTRVLLIDDDEGFTRLLHFRLEQVGGFEVVEINDSGYALPAARRFHPQVILLDVVMPGMDGVEVASLFERDSEFRETPIIFVTASVPANEFKYKGVLRHEGRTYVEKPFRSDELIACMMDLIANGRKASHVPRR